MIKISVTGPYGGFVDKDLVEYVKTAINFFIKELKIDDLPLNIDVRIHNKSFINGDLEGLTEKKNDHSFRITLCLFCNWVSVLAHEMVHVKQFAKGEINESLTQWKSRKYTGNIDYWDQPWEKQARKLQLKLMRKYDKRFQIGE